jgi:hypothetical protein
MDRFELVMLGEIAHWMETGDADLAAVRAASADLRGDDRIWGIIGIADIESRLAVERGEDVWTPWVRARAALGVIPIRADRRIVVLRAAAPIIALLVVAAVIVAAAVPRL